ncbi:hypothetical protein D9611_006389 [Ephemerocybe angulata]|uniref:Uncharacterized protein n=1 Tax=Ephemerocybe angulata TaxID=980116 RepID=A0A8H5FGR7_9AGAR|nr:hypothetical protein D9611_006389 [Tulosesus angulatus]
MDDPWADPWGDSSKKAPTEDVKPLESKWNAVPSLGESIRTVKPVEPPSWEPKESTAWAPPTVQVDPAPSWGDELPSWTSPGSSLDNPTTIESFSLAEGEDSTTRFDQAEESDESRPSTPTTQVIEPDDEEASPVVAPVDLPAPSFRNSSPGIGQSQELEVDGFGGFESGLESAATEDNAGWLPSPNSFTEPEAVGGDVWGNSWGSEDSISQAQEEEQPDEWEAARQRKEEQDKHVILSYRQPPEYLDNIITLFEGLGSDLWKKESELDASSAGHRRYDPQSLNLNSSAEKIVPDELSLPLALPFPQTFTSKRLVDALKLTRHAHLTSKGPVAMYMNSKGSTTWEASIKAKPDITQQDVAPAGWKIVPRSESPVPDATQKRASSGGILSFFTRRSTNSPNPGTPQRSGSPASSLPASVRAETSSPRPSIDTSVSRAPSQGKEKASATASPSSSLFQSTAPTQSPVNVSSPAAVQAPTKAPDVFSPEDEHDDPAPSTMSRFFGRFGRGSRSTALSQHESVSLSADDLEFLSDVVPVAQIAQEGINDSAQMKALSSMIQSSPLPTALPPPLAPPPSGPQLKAAMPRPAVAPRIEEDLFSLFETSAPFGSNTSTNDDKQRQPLPSIPHSSLGALSPAPAKTTITPPLSFPDFFSSATSPPALPPPPIPPKFTPPLGTTSSMTRTSNPANSPLLARMTTTPSAARSTLIPTLLPPPPSTNRPRIPNGQGASSRSQTPSIVTPPSQPTIDEDDEFADFITSPVNPSQAASFTPSMIPIIPSTTSNAMDFDDFSDFLTPVPQTQTRSRGSTPGLTHSAHNSMSASQSSLSSSTGTKSSSSSPRVSRAEHQRTLSLLEVAANRGDAWLSPPSPLPAPLPPPDAPAKKATDLLSGNSMEAQQERAIASLAPPPKNMPLPAERQVMSSWSFPSAPVPANKPTRALSPPMQPQYTPPVVSTPPPSNALPPSRSGSSGWSFPPPPGMNGLASRTTSPPVQGRVTPRAVATPPIPPANTTVPIQPSGSGWSFPPPPSGSGSVSRAFSPPMQGRSSPRGAATPPPAVNPVAVPSQLASSGWNFPPPPTMNGPSAKTTSPPPPAAPGLGGLNLGTFSPPKPTSQRPVPSAPVPAPTPAAASKGGLSASDLAFFEGL